MTTTAAGLALTFDDAYVEQWHALLPLLAEHGARATFFVRDFDRRTDLELQQLRELAAAGHEIGCHGFRHRSVKLDYGRDPGRAAEYLEVEVLPAIAAMHERGFQPASFAYPHGHSAPAYDRLLLGHFRQLRAVVRGQRWLLPRWLPWIYHRPGSGARLHRALGIDLHYGLPDARLASALEHAQATGRVVLLYAHEPGDSGRPFSLPYSRLAFLFRHARERGLRWATVGELD